MHACQIYVWGNMHVLLNAIKGQWTAQDTKVALKMKNVVDMMTTMYALTPSELEALAMEGESVGRMMSLLVREHNKVSSVGKDCSALEVLVYMRAGIVADAVKRNISIPTTSDGVSVDTKRQLKAWVGCENTAFYERMKIALVSERNFQEIVKIYEANMAVNEEAQAKQVKKRKSMGGEGKETKEIKLDMRGVEKMVEKVDEAGVYKMLREINNGERDMASIKSWVADWTLRKSKLFLCDVLAYAFCWHVLFYFVFVK
jgi:hypothetical protein